MALINPITAGQGLNPGAGPSTARDNSVASGLVSLGNASAHEPDEKVPCA